MTTKTRRTSNERLAEINKKIEQMQAQAKAVEQKIKADERKKRTKRLIAIGAEVEHYAACEIVDMDALKKYLAQYGYAIAATQAATQKTENQ